MYLPLSLTWRRDPQSCAWRSPRPCWPPRWARPCPQSGCTAAPPSPPAQQSTHDAHHLMSPWCHLTSVASAPEKVLSWSYYRVSGLLFRWWWWSFLREDSESESCFLGGTELSVDHRSVAHIVIAFGHLETFLVAQYCQWHLHGSLWDALMSSSRTKILCSPAVGRLP